MRKYLLTTALALLLAAPAMAENRPDASPSAHPDMRDSAARERWRAATPEQRQKMRSEARDKWKEMTPEERAATKDKAKTRFDSLPQEQQKKIKARRQKHKETNGAHHEDRHHNRLERQRGFHDDRYGNTQ